MKKQIQQFLAWEDRVFKAPYNYLKEKGLIDTVKAIIIIKEINGEYKITIETKRSFAYLIRITREINADLSKQLSKKCYVHVRRVDLNEDEVIYSVKEYFEQAQNDIDISYDEIFVTPLHNSDRIEKNRLIRISMKNSTRALRWISLSVKEYAFSNISIASSIL